MMMKIGELAKLAGYQVVTIRYYEKEGLLSEPQRTDANYRLYSTDDIERLRFIKHCRRHGIKVSEIRELLAFKDASASDCGWITTLIAKQIKNVTEQIESLTRLKKELETLQQKCSLETQAGCGILKSLSESDDCTYCESFRGLGKK